MPTEDLDEALPLFVRLVRNPAIVAESVERAARGAVLLASGRQRVPLRWVVLQMEDQRRVVEDWLEGGGADRVTGDVVELMGPAARGPQAGAIGVLGRAAPSLTSGLWNSRPGREWMEAQHCSQ